MGIGAKVKTFVSESRLEFKRINWPTFAETRKLTLLVVFFSLVIAAFLGVGDALFSYALRVFFLE